MISNSHNRFPGGASPPPVPDQPVTEQRPLLFAHQFDEFRSIFTASVCLVSPSRFPKRVTCIHHDAHVDVERISQNDIRRLAPHAVQCV